MASAEEQALQEGQPAQASLPEAKVSTSDDDGADDGKEAINSGKESSLEKPEESELPATETSEQITATETSNAAEIEEAVVDNIDPPPQPPKKGGKAAKSKSKTTKKATVTKKQKASAKAKKPTEKAKPKPAAKKNTAKKAAPKGKAASSNKGKAKGKASSKKEQVEVPEPAAASAAGLDLFTKHYREFERSLLRLEKMDQFGYFWDPAPEEFVEDYTKKQEESDTTTTLAAATSEKGDKPADNEKAEIGEADSSTETNYPCHPPFNWEMIRRRRDQGRYILDVEAREEQRLHQINSFLDEESSQSSSLSSNKRLRTVSVLHPKGIKWDLFRKDVSGMCDSAIKRNPDEVGDGKTGSLSYAVKKIKGELDKIYERTACRHINDMVVANGRHQFNSAMERTTNMEAAFQGKWRQTPFPERKYERLPTKNVVCAGLSALDERIASYELQTSLPDSFVGFAYKYEDDTGKSEAWMKSVLVAGDRKGKKKAQETALALAKDEGVIRAQVATCMEGLLIAVQDRVMTDADVLHLPELRSANWEADYEAAVCVEKKSRKEPVNTANAESVAVEANEALVGSPKGEPVNNTSRNDVMMSETTDPLPDSTAGEPIGNTSRDDMMVTEPTDPLSHSTHDSSRDGTMAVKAAESLPDSTAAEPINDSSSTDGAMAVKAAESLPDSTAAEPINDNSSTDGAMAVKAAKSLADSTAAEPVNDSSRMAAEAAEPLTKLAPEVLANTPKDDATGEATASSPQSTSGELANNTTKEDIMGEATESLPDSTPDIVEQPVWGMDCYTRRNVLICLGTEFDEKTALVFVEKWLLPAINACPVDLAHDIGNAALILEGLPFVTRSEETDDDGKIGQNKDLMAETEERWSHSLIGKSLVHKIRTTGPPWLKLAAQLLRRARKAMGPDFFRIHPKGHGSIVLSPVLQPNTLVTFYRGEVFPSWRWGEKTDAIDITQARKKLKPNLPDFYNMALERPQKDPRKYSLLFVDASRKAGHGSSISHSCAPTCEVRVAALNGELCLAMTTLRHIEMGEELTFDYNAVTESLVEYRSAVCLCGYGKCRGSFLHFATADCYQRVLDRNLPVAVRFSSLAKGCMKEVMSDEDERTLRNHGFMTAAFGAISVNRHNTSGLDSKQALMDSMDNVPVWLRTYVADTLRYIEYERRALPISLINEDLSKPKADAPALINSSSEKATNNAPKSPQVDPKGAPENEADGSDDESEECEKRIKGSRPMPTFFFYTRDTNSAHRRMLKAEGLHEKDLPGLEYSKALKRIGGEQWKLLSIAEKAKWKKKAEKEWEKNGGLEKALLEKKRKQGGLPDKKAKPQSKKPRKSKESLKSKLESSNISFPTADAEGVAAMEQRIQQLTQSLSRVGRVLDRHRETFHVSENGRSGTSSDALRSQVLPPMTVAADEQVVSWLWNDENGIVRTLLAKTAVEEFISPSLKLAFGAIMEKYEVLDKFGCHSSPPSEFPIKPYQARKKLTTALIEFRRAILRDLKAMAKDLKKQKVRAKTEKKKRQYQEKQAKKKPKKDSKATTSDAATTQDPVDSQAVASQQLRSPKSDRHEENDAMEVDDTSISTQQPELEDAKANLSSAMEVEADPDSHEDSQESSIATPCLLSEEVKAANDTVAVAVSEETAEVLPSEEMEMSEDIVQLGPTKADCSGGVGPEDTLALSTKDESTVTVEGEVGSSAVAFDEDSGNVASKNDPTQVTSKVESAQVVGKEESAQVVVVVKEESAQVVVKEESAHVVATEEDTPLRGTPSEPVETAEYTAPVVGAKENHLPAADSEVQGDSVATCNRDDGANASPEEEDVESVVADVLRQLVDSVVTNAERTKKEAKDKKQKEEDDKPKPWLKHYGQRFKLQAAADVLLMYARTSTFFLLQPYEPLKSTPIEVYAREIGNAVPRSVIDRSVSKKNKGDNASEPALTDNGDASDQSAQSNEVSPKKSTDRPKRAGNIKSQEKGGLADKEELCQPDDIVAEVTVTYQGDYVLSQLLQWYNGGIGQSSGLPETLGCIRLPSLSGCWDKKCADSSKPKLNKPTSYESTTRPRLVNWFSDPHQRGSPWPEELNAAFTCEGSDDLPKDTSNMWLPLGSPIIDLLVTGDDFNIRSILEEFGADDEKKSTEKGLLSTVDEGRPAQATSNWVCCENSDCGKWRKIPWHVDIDVLAKQFVCSDNKWNKGSSTCDAPEDEYEKHENDVVGPDGQLKALSPSPKKAPAKRKRDGVQAAKKKKEGTKAAKKADEKKKIEDAAKAAAPVVVDIPIPVPVDEVIMGARFDVKRGKKDKYAVGKVVEMIEENGTKKAKFHFSGRDARYDEAVEVGSPRICPLYSKAKKPVYKPRKYVPKEGTKQKSKKKTEGIDLAALANIVTSIVGEASASQSLAVAAAATKILSFVDAELTKKPSPSVSCALPDGVKKKSGHPISSEQIGLASLAGSLDVKKKRKKTKKRKSPDASSAWAATNAAPAEGDGQPLAQASPSMLTKKSPKRVKEAATPPRVGAESTTSNVSPVLEQIARAVQQEQESTCDANSFNQASLAAAVISADVKSAIAGLASLAGRIPQKPRDAAAAAQPSGVQSVMLDRGGLWNQNVGPTSSQFASQVSSPNRPSGASSQQFAPTEQSMQLEQRIRQQQAEAAISQQSQQQQRVTQQPQETSPERLQAISQLYSAMDNQAQLRRMREVENAMHAEVQRQRLQQQVQQQVQQALQEEIQRQRIPQLYSSMDSRVNALLNGSVNGAARSYPNNTASSDPRQPTNNNPRQQQPPSYSDYSSFGLPQNGNGNEQHR